MEVGRSKRDSEYLAIRVVLQGREITVIYCYCPPDKDLQLHTLPLVNHNLLITGDFNGHSPSWGYTALNSRGEQIEDWMVENSLILINRPDDQPKHLSRAWKILSTPHLGYRKRGHSVDLCQGGLHPAGRQRPFAGYTVTLTEQNTSQKKEPGWNYKKAGWSKFPNLTDVLCRGLHIGNNKNVNTSLQ